MRSHLIRIGIYGTPLPEKRLDFRITREFTSVGLAKSALYLLNLIRSEFDKCFEGALDDP